MDITIEDLSGMGKHAFELTFRTGQFFFPKLAIGRPGEHTKIEIAQYDSEFDGLLNLLKVVSTLGPVDWIAHTADSYTLELDTADEALLSDINRGITSPSALFEAEDPRAVEALQIVMVRQDRKIDAVTLPYRRLSNRIEWLEVPVFESDASGHIVEAMHTAIKVSHSLS